MTLLLIVLDHWLRDATGFYLALYETTNCSLPKSGTAVLPVCRCADVTQLSPSLSLQIPGR